MKHFINRKLAAAALLGAAAATLAVSVASASKQPHMDDALTALRSAKAALAEAKANKGGHRVKAIQLVNDAIVEVEKGIAAAE